MTEDRRRPAPGIRRAIVAIVAAAASIGLVACGGTSATSEKTPGRLAGEGTPSTTGPPGSPSAPTTGSSQSSTNPSALVAPPSSVPAGSSELQAAQKTVDAVDADFVAQNWAAL